MFKVVVTIFTFGIKVCQSGDFGEDLGGDFRRDLVEDLDANLRFM